MEEALGNSGSEYDPARSELAWPEELLTAFIALIPKLDGDARPQSQRPITLLPVLYRLRSSTRARAVLLLLGDLVPRGVQGGCRIGARLTFLSRFPL